jgi:hypothetical protein
MIFKMTRGIRLGNAMAFKISTAGAAPHLREFRSGPSRPRTLNLAKLCHRHTLAIARTSASHLIRPLNLEGTLGDESGDSHPVVEFMIVDTIIGRGPFFTNGSAHETLTKSEKQVRQTHNPFRGVFTHALSKSTL